MKKKKRILYIVQHRYNRSPGQRYRCEQYIPYLEKDGFECVYAPIMPTEQEDKDFYSAGNYFKKLGLFIKGAYRRWQDVQKAKDFDIVYVYREAFMTGTTWFEQQMKKSGAKMVFDFDDAIWNFDVSEGNKALGKLKRPDKVNDIMAMSDLVLAGNSYLQQHAAQYTDKAVVFPSTIDLDYYKVPPRNRPRNMPIVIGWSGSLTTIEHFKPIVPVLLRLKEKYGNKIEFRVFGVPTYTHKELGIKGIQWTPENEVQHISLFDIGIMPLPNNEWSKGKCGMKGLQYMALEVATVMTAVGANKDIIQDGQNGMLALTDDEWFDRLSQLIDSVDLRVTLGKAGRKTIEQHYSCQALNNTYVGYFNKLIGQ